jgi:hypothetical protein
MEYDLETPFMITDLALIWSLSEAMLANLKPS